MCHVSVVLRGRSPGNCFPQLGPSSLSSWTRRLSREPVSRKIVNLALSLCQRLSHSIGARQNLSKGTLFSPRKRALARPWHLGQVPAAHNERRHLQRLKPMPGLLIKIALRSPCLVRAPSQTSKIARPRVEVKVDNFCAWSPSFLLMFISTVYTTERCLLVRRLK
jgi:hypothetical protein